MSSKVTFKTYEKQIKSPFIIYVRFEAIRVPEPESVLVHQPCGFAYSIKCSFDNSLSKCESYYGENCAKVLWEKLKVEAKTISDRMKSKVDPQALSDKEKSLFDNTTHCYFCGDEFHEDKCEDFFQPSGEFLGAAHKSCREKQKLSKCIPVVVSKHGIDFLLKELSVAEISRISFVGNVKKGTYGFMGTFPNLLTLKFIHEENLLDEEIELDSILKDSKKKSLKNRFKKKADFDLIKLKTYFPFSHVESFGKFDEDKLPPKPGFYDQLEDEDISDENYQRSVKIWDRFKCQTISDYLKVCLESSVLLLEDVFENFRLLSLDKYGLDPAHYFTIASFAWDAMLRYTRVKLELLQKRDMINFIKNNIRGGIVQCSKRYAKANNKYCNDYNSEKSSNFIIYLDANNLAGWAMSQKLPFSEFEWLNKTQIEKIKPSTLKDDSDYGYIFEVDLDYPKSLHQKHNDLPFCCERLTIPPPPTATNLTRSHPILNFYKKKNYVIDYRNLKQCLDNGLVLSKIHRVLKFKQTNWLEPYITYNTKLRARSKNDFEKNLYKRLNNSVYGKTIQKATNDKPSYAGFCILELSKKFMYNFHYKEMLPRYENRITLLYMDTDCFIYEIQTLDFYQDLKSDKKLLRILDTSNLDSKWEIPAKNKKALGKMKDDYGGKIIFEFCGVGAKVYCLDVEGEEIKKAVGMKKYIKRKYISKSDYRNCVMNDVQIRKTFLETTVSNYQMRTIKMTKTVLSPGDRKRCIMMDKINTRAWGYEE